MLRKRLLVGTALLLSLGAPRPAAASGYTEWLNACGGTNFVTCASVKLWVTASTVKIHVWNLSAGLDHLSADGYRGGVFTQISLLNLPGSIQGPNNATVNMSGPYYSVGNPGTTGRWVVSDPEAGGSLQVGAPTNSNPAMNGIASNCAANYPNLVSGTKQWMSRTCYGGAWTLGGSSLNGYAVEMTFDVANNQTFDPAGIGLGITSVDVGDVRLTSYQQLSATYTTPEPVSMLLLGSGLLGVGGLGLKRRRRREADPLSGA